MMHQFNQTMHYLEQQLTGEVDMKRFKQLSGYSYPLFSRLFSILADMTLAEYLRNRRMLSAQPSRNSMGQLPQKFEMENLIGSFLDFNYP